MSGSLHQLIYCSRNAIPRDGAELEREIENILAAARRNNRALSITGALLFTQGCFVQALEGEHDPIEVIFEKIQCDERHADVTVLSFEPVDERAFPAWDMEFLGIAGPGTPATVAAMTLNEAFRRKQAKAEHILRLMRDVAIRERSWAGT